jgi:hypothetical protein
VKEGKILEARLAGATTAAGLDGRGIGDAPGERQDLDFVLVFGVDGFAFDVANFCKDV